MKKKLLLLPLTAVLLLASCSPTDGNSSAVPLVEGEEAKTAFKVQNAAVDAKATEYAKANKIAIKLNSSVNVSYGMKASKEASLQTASGTMDFIANLDLSPAINLETGAVSANTSTVYLAEKVTTSDSEKPVDVSALVDMSDGYAYLKPGTNKTKISLGEETSMMYATIATSLRTELAKENSSFAKSVVAVVTDLVTKLYGGLIGGNQPAPAPMALTDDATEDEEPSSMNLVAEIIEVAIAIVNGEKTLEAGVSEIIDKIYEVAPEDAGIPAKADMVKLANDVITIVKGMEVSEWISASYNANDVEYKFAVNFDKIMLDVTSAVTKLAAKVAVDLIKYPELLAQVSSYIAQANAMINMVSFTKSKLEASFKYTNNTKVASSLVADVEVKVGAASASTDSSSAVSSGVSYCFSGSIENTMEIAGTYFTLPTIDKTTYTAAVVQ